MPEIHNVPDERPIFNRMPPFMGDHFPIIIGYWGITLEIPLEMQQLNQDNLALLAGPYCYFCEIKTEDPRYILPCPGDT